MLYALYVHVCNYVRMIILSMCLYAFSKHCCSLRSGECPNPEGPLTVADPDERLGGFQGQCWNILYSTVVVEVLSVV